MYNEDTATEGSSKVQLTMLGTLVTGVLLMSAGKAGKLLAMPGLFGNWGFTPVAPICCPPVWLKGCPKGLVLPAIPICKRMKLLWLHRFWKDIKKKKDPTHQIPIFVFTKPKFWFELFKIRFSTSQLQITNNNNLKIHINIWLYTVSLSASEDTQFNKQKHHANAKEKVRSLL